MGGGSGCKCQNTARVYVIHGTLSGVPVRTATCLVVLLSLSSYIFPVQTEATVFVSDEAFNVREVSCSHSLRPFDAAPHVAPPGAWRGEGGRAGPRRDAGVETHT